MRGARVRMLVLAALCVAAAAACTGTQEAGSAPQHADAAGPADAGSPAPAEVFTVTVGHISIVGMDNAAILGAAGAQPDNEAAVRAVTGARDALTAFLNAQFVAQDTRFGAGPIEGLLSPRALGALTDEDRAGLGQVALPGARAVPGPADATAQVLLVGNQVDAVTLTYQALLTVVLADDTHVPARQSGAMTFLPTDAGWRADAVEVTTDLPEAGP